MRLLCVLLLVYAPAMWACSPTDRDSFIDGESVLAGITGLWDSSVGPVSDLPMPRPTAESQNSTAAPEEPEEKSRTRTWITLGVLFVLLALGALTKARITRSAASVVNESDKPEATS